MSSTTKKWINKKNHLTINNIKLNFLKKTSSMLYPVKRHFKYQEHEWVQVLSAKTIISALTVKRLVVEQFRFLQRQWRARSFKFKQKCKLYVLTLKLRVEKYELNFGLQFSKTLAESNFETKVFSGFNFYIACY